MKGISVHQTVLEFIRHLEQQGRLGSVESYELGLRLFSDYLEHRCQTPTDATSADLRAYQVWLAKEYRKADGQPLSKGTQVTRLTPVLAYYRFLERGGLVLANPAKSIRLPRMPRNVTRKDYLDLQEANALIQTQATRVLSLKKGSPRWAERSRDLAMFCLALATGRRRQSLLSLKVSELDLLRNELRVVREKGRPGRVLPVARWAVDVCRIYLDRARGCLLRGREDKGFLFPGSMNDSVSPCAFYGVVRRLHRCAAEENPDLEELANKRITPHSLRVSFATLLFRGGCNIRSINELMLHSSLSTTARYTPIPFEDLQRVCRQTHPRA
jgi:integrase/recombinase XerD